MREGLNIFGNNLKVRKGEKMGKKIKKLEIINFRGIKEGKLEFGDLTIIVGSNNSAKTTILEALFLAPNPLRRVPYIKEGGAPFMAASLIHELHKTLYSEGYAFLLHKYVAEKAAIRWNNTELKLVKKDDDILLVSSKILCSIPSDLPQEKGQAFGRLPLSSSKLQPTCEKELLMPETLLISPGLVGYAEWYIHSGWIDITNSGIPVEIAKDISHLTNEEYTNITIEPFLGGKLAIFGLLKDGSRIRLGDIGAGIKVYITSRILYELKKPRILLWDDVEAHMNPRMLIRIAEWFSELLESGVQVVTTTHSLEAVRILSEFNKDATIYVTSLENGMLRAEKMKIEDVESLISAGIDIRMVGTAVL